VHCMMSDNVIYIYWYENSRRSFNTHQVTLDPLSVVGKKKDIATETLTLNGNEKFLLEMFVLPQNFFLHFFVTT